MTRRERVLQAIQDRRANGKGWVRAPCPFCPEVVGTPDKHACLSANVEVGGWKCFRCGMKGRLRDGDDRPEAPPPPPVSFSPPLGFEYLAGSRSISAEPARRHLLDRNLGPDIWEAARLGVCLSGFYYGRIVVPFFAPDGKTWTGYCTRSWVKKASRPYRYAKDMPREELIYDPGSAFVAPKEEPILVVEGCLDALALWPDGVALLGMESQTQIEMLEASPRPVVVVLDGDAWRHGWALAMRLRLAGQRAGAVRLPPGKDPDEVDRDKLRADAVESLEAA